MKYSIKIQRIYAPECSEDGFRCLVDRLWPRGFKKSALFLDLWLPNIAPSSQLRKSWHQEVLSFDDFREAYETELAGLEEELLPLLIAARKGKVTLLSSVKNIEVSHLPILKDKLVSLLLSEDQLVEGNEQSSSPCYLSQFNTFE